MSIRVLVWGALCAGSCLLGTACVNKADARASPLSQPPEEKAGAFCGGLAALPCPEGYACIDDPNDSCDPARNGADCGGICAKDLQGDAERERERDKEKDKDPPAQCDGQDPARRYVSQDPAQCAAIRFFCDPGYQPFFNDCGCGCEPAP